MALPLLPGYSFNRNAGKEKFHKSQHWGFCNNVRMLLSEEKPGIGGEPLLGQKVKTKFSTYPKGEGSDGPSWVVFDRQVLCFDAYVEDEMIEKRQEIYRIRYYKIYFYPEDDTIEVNEPEVENSGLPQGTSIRRHRIALPPPNDDQFYTVYDFNINVDIVFYGRTFKIYDCDKFTKNFLRKIGVKLNPPGRRPEDPYLKMRKEVLEHVEPLRPYESFDTLRQFLQYDGKVLRFFCLWDDSGSLFGDRRELVLHYFLSDDTIEIKQALPDNSGRDAREAKLFFLRRSKLPKYGPPGIYQPGQITDHSVLNVFGGTYRRQKFGYVMDKYKLGKVDQEFYKDSDLFLGATINVWGRKVLLCDCDEFTKSYYKSKYGIENFTPVSCKPPPPPKIERKFPPYTGFGSEEDSLRSCLSLKPVPYVKKLLKEDSYGNIGNVLRFFARLITAKCADADRIFVISYFLNDGTLSVFEPIERNSGYTGGLFLKRSRVKKYGQEVFKSEFSEYIQVEELYIGAKVNVNGYLFVLLSADEYTLNYMEKNVDKFPFSNIELALQKLKDEESKSREIKQVFAAADCNHTKMVDFNTFRDLLLNITVNKLIDQEIITIARCYRVPEDIDTDVNLLIAQAQEKLKKNMFEQFDRVIFSCVYEDREKKNVLPSRDIKRLCKTHRFPFTDDFLENLLSRFEDSEGQINYKSLFHILNWRINPMSELQAPDYLKERCEDVWFGMPSPIPVKFVRYLDLLKDMYGLE